MLRAATMIALFLCLCGALTGCGNHDRDLARDEEQFHVASAVALAHYDREIEDAVIDNMVQAGSMSEHSAVVFEECREANSKTPTCLKLQARVKTYEKKHTGDWDKQLHADGVK